MAVYQGTILDEGGAVHNVRAYGAAGDGTTDDTAAFAAVTAGRLFVPPGTYAIAAPLTFPPAVQVELASGAVLRPAADVAVTFSLAPAAGRYRIFDTAGGGRFAFADGAAEGLMPEWFGARRNGTSNDSAAINAAIDALPPGGGTVHFARGFYFLGSATAGAVRVLGGRNNVRLVGEGPGDVTNLGVVRHGTVLRYTGMGPAVQIGVPVALPPSPDPGACSHVSVRNLRIDLWNGSSGTWRNRTGVGLLAYRTRFLTLENVQFTTIQKSNNASGETAVRLDGDIDFSGWTTWIGCYIRGDFTYGVHVRAAPTSFGAGAITMIGGAMHQTVNNATPAGTVGLLLERGQDNSVFGTDFDGWDTAVEAAASSGNTFTVRCEPNGNNTEFRLRPTSVRNTIVGGSWDPARIVVESPGPNVIVPPGVWSFTADGRIGRAVAGPAEVLDLRGAGAVAAQLYATGQGQPGTGGTARFVSRSEVRAWSTGVQPDGSFALRDETAGGPALEVDAGRALRLAGALRLAPPAQLAGGPTPSVAGGNVFWAANEARTEIDDFADGLDGQEILVRLDAHTSVRGDPARIVLRQGAVIPAGDQLVRFVRIGGVWYQS